MQPQNQTLLTIIITACLSIAFVGTYALDMQFRSTSEAEVVWESDSDLQFASLDVSTAFVGLQDPPLTTYGLGSYMFYGWPSYTSYWSYNSTGVYLGNNTWGASMIGWTEKEPDFATALYNVPIAIEEARTFMVESIQVSIKIPTDLSHMSFGLGGYTTPAGSQYPGDVTGVVLSNTIPYTGSVMPYYNATYILTAYQALTWYNLCQHEEMTPSMSFSFYDLAHDGMSSYAMDFSINITGRYMTSWNLQDSINVVLGASIGVNVFLMIYMTDAIDFGGVKRKELDRGNNRKRR